MFELLSLFVFIWLLSKTIGLALKLTWGVAKIDIRKKYSNNKRTFRFHSYAFWLTF